MNIFNNGKTAAQIAMVLPEKDNTYEVDIHAAATFLVRRGDGAFKYRTHYSSGSTVWGATDTGAGETIPRQMAKAAQQARASKGGAA